MKILTLTVCTVFFTCLSLTSGAQDQTDSLVSLQTTPHILPGATGPKYNFLKVNLTGFIFKNYSLQYERVINKTVSAALSFRTMPATTLPFKKQLLESAGDDQDTRDLIENFKLSNFAITPEIRFYLGRKGYGRGFYIAPFYRYAAFKTNQWIITVDNTTEEKTINMSGNLKSNTGGIMFGAQWAIGSNLVLDWWILGPHYGKATGNFMGVPNKPLTPTEQEELRNNLEDFDLPLTEKTITVNANNATLRLDGPWAGVRAGITFGVRF